MFNVYSVLVNILNHMTRENKMNQMENKFEVLYRVSAQSFLNQSFYQSKCCKATLLNASERDDDPLISGISMHGFQ